MKTDPHRPGTLDRVPGSSRWLPLGAPAGKPRVGLRAGWFALLMGPGLLAAADSTLTLLDQFTVPHPAADVVFDAVRGEAWLSDALSKQLVQVGLAERGVVNAWAVDHQPESLALTPDGHWLYAALITRPHNSYWFSGREGYIAELELGETPSLSVFHIDEDPYDLVATDDRALIVASGSGQSTALNVYQAASLNPDVVTSTRNIRQGSPLLLAPSQTAAFSITTDLSPTDITHWVLDGSGNLIDAWDSPYHGGVPMSAPWWVQPDGARLFTAVGGVFQLSTNRSEDLTHVRTLPGAPFTAMAFDATNRTVFAVAAGRWWQFNLGSLEEGPHYTNAPTAGFLFLYSTNLLAVTPKADRTVFTVFANPAIGAAANQDPVAAFSWTPAVPTVLDFIQFSAAETTDDGPAASLQFRWDWNGDSLFDTEFSADAVASHRFEVAGTKTVVLEVRDGFGAASRLTRTVDVALASDPGNPTSTNAAFSLPFAATDLAADPERPFLYASDTAGKRLVRVNLLTGFIDREFHFDLGPERLCITPGAERLYVVLPAQPHTYYGGTQSGLVAEVDLATGTRTRVVEVNADPYDIVATDDGLLVISSGSNQWTSLSTHAATTGQRLGTAGVYMGAILALATDQRAVYQFDAGLSPADLNRHNLAADGTFTASWDSPYHGDYPTGTPFPHPSGDKLISSGGSIYTASADRALDLCYLGPLTGGAFDDLVFDPANRAFFVVRAAGANRLTAYNLDSLQEAGGFAFPAPVRRVGLSDGRLVLVSFPNNETRLAVIPNPMEGASTNQPPVARFRWTPSAPTTLDRIVFDASESSDDAGSGNLSARWDWDGDGVFDTPFAPLGPLTNRFSFAATYVVVVEIRDRFGAVDRATNLITVALASDPGVPSAHDTPYRLACVPADVAFDPVRPYVYATDKPGRRLLKLNLATGLVEREWGFDLPPESLAITPNGSRLYVGLLTREHDTYWFGQQTGALAEYDLAAGVKLREFPVTIDPFDLVASDSGWIICSSGSGQWTSIKSFSAATGLEVAATSTYERSRLSLGPAQDLVFASVPLYPSDFQRIELDPVTGQLTSRGDSPYHGDHPMGFVVWALADGRHVVTSEGGVYTALQAYVTQLNFPVNDALALTNRSQLVTVAQDKIRTFALDEFTLQSEMTVPGEARYLGDSSGFLWTVSSAPARNETLITRRRYPARNAGENLAASVVVTRPEDGTGVAEGQAVTVQATALDEDGEVRQVAIYLDGAPATLLTASPWAAQLTSLSLGDHSIQAVATDNLGATNTSAPVTITVSRRPEVTLTAAVVDATPLATVELTAQASDPDGSVVSVTFSVGTNELATVATLPFRFLVTNVARGVYTYTALARDEHGVVSLPAVTHLLVGLPPGDLFAYRIPVSGADLALRANNVDATSEPGEPRHAGVTANRSLWWEWTPPSGVVGTVVLDTAGSLFDTVLAVYAGDSLATLRELASNDNVPAGSATSRVKLPISGLPGLKLQIAVDGRNGAGGEVSLGLRFLPDPVSGGNDRFAERQLLIGSETEAVASNSQATAEPGEPSHAANRAQHSLWWTWTAPASGPVRIETTGSTFDTVLAVYGGTNLAQLLVVAANDDQGAEALTSRVEFHAQAETSYQIAVDGYQGATGIVRLALLFRRALLTWVPRENGNGELRVNADPGETVVIEHSADFESWLPLQTIQVQPGPMVWPVINPASESRQFFRARPQ
jgi:hypothetical protein